jgi:hypothetical protein
MLGVQPKHPTPSNSFVVFKKKKKKKKLKKIKIFFTLELDGSWMEELEK